MVSLSIFIGFLLFLASGIILAITSISTDNGYTTQTIGESEIGGSLGNSIAIPISVVEEGAQEYNPEAEAGNEPIAEENHSLSDTESVSWNDDKEPDNSSGNGAYSYSSHPITSEYSYIGNKNTHKFHYSYCRSVKNMAESNKVAFSDRDEAINKGYVPCKRCNP